MMVILDILLGIWVLCVLFCIMMLFRNGLIYKYRIRRLNGVSVEARYLISRRADDFLAPYREFENSPSYEKMFWQLHKWTYSSFYGK